MLELHDKQRRQDLTCACMPCCSCCGLSVSFLGVTLINYFLKYSVMMRRDGRPARAASRIRFERSSCLLNMSFLFTSFWRGPSCPKQKHFLWPHSNQQLFDPAQRLGVQRMTLYAQLGLTADCFVSQVKSVGLATVAYQQLPTRLLYHAVLKNGAPLNVADAKIHCLTRSSQC